MTSSSETADNKRAYIRLKLNSKVRLQAEGSNEEHTGRCVDMSGSGLMVVTDAPFEVGDAAVAKIESKGTDIVYNTTVTRIVGVDSDRKLALSINEILD